MRAPTRLGLITVAAAVVIGVALVAVLLVRSDPDTPTAPGTDAGQVIDPRTADPTTVAVTVMSGLYTWQPAVQSSSWDALHSQQTLLTGTIAAAAAQRPDPEPHPLTDWAAWARSKDVVTAVVQPTGDPKITADTATVEVTITQTVQHRNGDSTPYGQITSVVSVRNDGGTWKVQNYTVR